MRQDVFAWAVTRGIPLDVAETIASVVDQERSCRILLARVTAAQCDDCGEQHVIEPTLQEIRDFGCPDPVLDMRLLN
jgi:hypothetical protein